MPGKKSYKVGKDVYDIPENEVSGFLSKFPNAVEVQSFVAGKDTFDIPIAEVQGFLQSKPGAKPLGEKKSPVGNDSGSGGVQNPQSPLQSPSSSEKPLRAEPLKEFGSETKAMLGKLKEYGQINRSRVESENAAKSRDQAAAAAVQQDFALGVVQNRMNETTNAINRKRIENGQPMMDPKQLETPEVIGQGIEELSKYYDDKIAALQPAKDVQESPLAKIARLTGGLAVTAVMNFVDKDSDEVKALKEQKAVALNHATKLLRAKMGDGYETETQTLEADGKAGTKKVKVPLNYDLDRVKKMESDPSQYLEDMANIGKSVWDNRGDLSPKAQQLRAQPEASKLRMEASLEGLLARQLHVSGKLTDIVKAAQYNDEKRKALERVMTGKELAGDRNQFDRSELAIIEESKLLPKAFDHLTFSTPYGKEVRSGMLEQALLERLGQKVGTDWYNKEQVKKEAEKMKQEGLDPRDAALLDKVIKEGDFGMFSAYNQSTTGAFMKEAKNQFAEQRDFLAKQFGYGVTAAQGGSIYDYGRAQQQNNISRKDEDQYKAGSSFQVAASQFMPDYVLQTKPGEESFLEYVENTEGIGGINAGNIVHNSGKFFGQLAGQMATAAALGGTGAGFMKTVALPMYAATYNANLRDSYDIVGTDSPVKNYLYAGALSAMESVTEKIGNPLDQMQIFKNIFKTTLSKTLKGLTVDEIRNMGQATGKQFAKDVMTGLAGAGINAIEGMSGEAFEESVMQGFTNSAQMIANPEYAEANDVTLMKDVGKTFIETFLSMGVTGAGSMLSGYKNAKPSRLTQDAWAMVGASPETYRDQIKEAQERGDLTPEQANEKARLVNIAEKARLTTEKINQDYQKAGGTDLSNPNIKVSVSGVQGEHRTDRFVNMATANIIDLEEKISSTTDVTLQSGYQTQKAAFEKMRDDALNGKITIDNVTGMPQVRPQQVGDEIIPPSLQSVEATTSALGSLAPEVKDRIKSALGWNNSDDSFISSQYHTAKEQFKTSGYKDPIIDIVEKEISGIAPGQVQQMNPLPGQEETTETGQGETTPEAEAPEMVAVNQGIETATNDIAKLEAFIAKKEAKNPNDPSIGMIKQQVAATRKNLTALEKQKEKLAKKLAKPPKTKPATTPVPETVPATTPVATGEAKSVEPAALKGMRKDQLFGKVRLDLWLQNENTRLRKAFDEMPYDEFLKEYEAVAETYQKGLDDLMNSQEVKPEVKPAEPKQEVGQKQPEVVQEVVAPVTEVKPDAAAPSVEVQPKAATTVSPEAKKLALQNAETTDRIEELEAPKEDTPQAEAPIVNETPKTEIEEAEPKSEPKPKKEAKASQQAKTFAAKLNSQGVTPDTIPDSQKQLLDRFNMDGNGIVFQDGQWVAGGETASGETDTSDPAVPDSTNVKGVTTIEYEDDGDTILYGTKTNKVKVSILNRAGKLSVEEIKAEIEFEKRSLKSHKKDIENWPSNLEELRNSKTATSEDIASATKFHNSDLRNVEIIENIVIPFYEERLRFYETGTSEPATNAPKRNPKLVLRMVASGQMNADDAAVALDESGVEVTEELYDQLRAAEADYLKSKQGFQVDDRVLVKGQNGNPDFFANFRGESNGLYVVVKEGGMQMSVAKDLVSNAPETGLKPATVKLIEAVQKYGTKKEGKVSTADDGTQYRYDTWTTKYDNTPAWLSKFFEAAAGNETQFIEGDYSFAFQRAKFKGQPDGPITMSVLVELGKPETQDIEQPKTEKLQPFKEGDTVMVQGVGVGEISANMGEGMYRIMFPDGSQQTYPRGELTKAAKPKPKVTPVQKDGKIIIDEDGNLTDELPNQFENLKAEKNFAGLNDLYSTVRIFLNGVAQSKGENAVKQLENLKKDIEDYSNEVKAQPQRPEYKGVENKTSGLMDIVLYKSPELLDVVEDMIRAVDAKKREGFLDEMLDAFSGQEMVTETQVKEMASKYVPEKPAEVITNAIQPPPKIEPSKPGSQTAKQSLTFQQIQERANAQAAAQREAQREAEADRAEALRLAQEMARDLGLEGADMTQNAVLSSGNQTQINAYLQAARKVLSLLYPHATFEAYETEAEYIANGAGEGSRGWSIKGKNGRHRILLNLEAIRATNSHKTAVHEVIHPIVGDAFGLKPEDLVPIWNNLHELMKDVPGFEKVLEHISYYGPASIASEGMTELLTQIVVGNISLDNVPKSTVNKIIELLNKFFAALNIPIKLNTVSDFYTFSKDLKEMFDGGKGAVVKTITQKGKIDKLINEYNAAAADQIPPETIDKAVKLVGILTKSGNYKFADLIRASTQILPPQLAEGLFEAIKRGYMGYRALAPDNIYAQMDSNATILAAKFNDIIPQQNDTSSTTTQTPGGSVQSTSTTGRTGNDVGPSNEQGPSGMAENQPQGNIPANEGAGTTETVGGQQSESGTGATAGEGGSGTGNAGNVLPVTGNQGLNEEMGGETADPIMNEDPEKPEVAPQQQGRNFIIPRDFNHSSSFNPSQRLLDNIEVLKVLIELKESKAVPTLEQQKILFKFSGFGGIKEIHPVFSAWKDYNRKLQPLAEEFRRVLKEYAGNDYFKYQEAINNSIENAHYTEFGVIRGMYNVLKKMGFHGGNILDPSSGTGHFFGAMPYDMMLDSSRTAVELDRLTADIYRHLYPDTTLHNSGYEKVDYGYGTADLVISNIPFDTHPGQSSVGDEKFKKSKNKAENQSLTTLHNYFFARAINDARPNGLIAFVTSTGVMDSKGNDYIRKYMAENTEFLGAVRLPNTAFVGSANTQVTTDIIFLRKFGENETKKQNHNFTSLATASVAHKNPKSKPGKFKVTYNQYFKDNPDMMLGTLAAGSMWAGPVTGEDGETSDTAILMGTGLNLEQAITDRAEKIAGETVYEPGATSEFIKASQYIQNNGELRPGNLVVLSDGSFGTYTDELVKDRDLDQKANDAGVNPDKIRQSIEGERGVLYDEDMVRLKAAGLKVSDFNIRKVLPTSIYKKDAKAVPDFMKLRDALNKLYAAEFTNASVEFIENTRKELNNLYQGFLNKHGTLNDFKQMISKDEMDGQNVLQLEIVDNKEVTGTADILRKRVVDSNSRATTARDITDAIAINLSESIHLDIHRMADLLDKSVSEVIEEGKGIIFKNPITGRYETADEYLSGSTRQKLKEAKAAAETDPAYQDNVAALERSQPKDLPASEIYAPASAPWIADRHLSDFATQLLLQDVKVKRLSSGKIIIEGTDDRSLSVTQQWGVQGRTSRLNGYQILQHLMENRLPIIMESVPDGFGGYKQFLDEQATRLATEKLETMRQAFENWIWVDDDRRTELVNFYNENFNDEVPRVWDGSHLKFEGFTNFVTPRKSQKDGAWMVIKNMGGILDHEVGTGKSLTMALAANKMKKMGLIKKPIFIGLKANAAALAMEYRKAFPMAKILYPKESDFEKKNQRAFFAKIANNDWDIIIMTHENFGKIQQPKDMIEELYQDEMAELERDIIEAKSQDGQMSKRALSGLQDRKKKLAEKIQGLANMVKDPALKGFDEMNIDFMFVDESQQFKNLMYNTLQTRVAGLGDAKGSQKAFNLLVATRHLQKHWGGDKGVVFASGTPISNTMVEMFLLLKYLAPSELIKKGMKTFDRWANTFARISTNIEFSVTNSLKPKTRMARFANVPEMSSMYRKMADIRRAADMKDLDRPEFKKTFRLKATQQIPIGTELEIEGRRFKVIGGMRGLEPNEFHVNLKSLGKDEKINSVGTAKVVSSKTSSDVAERVISFSDVTYSDGLLVNIPISKQQKRIAEYLKRYAESKGKEGGYEVGITHVDNPAYMLLATTQAAKMAIDLRLIDPTLPDTETGKLGVAADSILDHYKDSTEHKGVQLIFSDIGTPKSPDTKQNLFDYLESKGVDADTLLEIFGEGINKDPATFPNINVVKKKTMEVMEWTEAEYESAVVEANIDEFNIYKALKEKLIRRGIPAHEIAFIHDYKTNIKKTQLKEDVIAGRIRVVIGSTAKLGTGNNFQEKIVALHHLDVPWRPSDMEQRNGRGIRTGNKVTKEFYNNELPIYYYATENTLDAYKYQLLDTKQAFIDQGKSSSDVREISEGEGDEESGVSYASMVAMLSGNPVILEKARIDKKVQELATSEKNFNQEKYNVKDKIKNRERLVENNANAAETYDKDFQTFKSNTEPITESKKTINYVSKSNKGGSDALRLDWDFTKETVDRLNQAIKSVSAETKEEQKDNAEKAKNVKIIGVKIQTGSRYGTDADGVQVYLPEEAFDITDTESIDKIARGIVDGRKTARISFEVNDPDLYKYNLTLDGKTYEDSEEGNGAIRSRIINFLREWIDTNKPATLNKEDWSRLPTLNKKKVIAEAYGFDIVAEVNFRHGESKVDNAFHTQTYFRSRETGELYKADYFGDGIAAPLERLPELSRKSNDNVSQWGKEAQELTAYLESLPATFPRQKELNEALDKQRRVDEQLAENEKTPDSETIVNFGQRITEIQLSKFMNSEVEPGVDFFVINQNNQPQRVKDAEWFSDYQEDNDYFEIYKFDTKFDPVKIMRRAKQYFTVEQKDPQASGGAVVGISQTTDNGIDEKNFTNYQDLREYLDEYEKETEPSALEKAKERVRRAWNSLGNIGVIYDPETQALKQIELFKALYEFAKEYIRDKALQARLARKNKGFVDYAIDELAGMLGVDAKTLAKDTELRTSVISAFEDAAQPAEQQRVQDTVFATIQASTNPESAMAGMVSFLNSELARAAQTGEETITVNNQKISYDQAENLLNYLQKRQNPFVTSKDVMAGGQYEMKDKEFQLLARDRALMMGATNSLPTTADEFIEALQRSVGRKIVGTKFEKLARQAYETEVKALELERQPSQGTARAPYHLRHTEPYTEAAGQLPELERRIDEMLDYERLRLKPEVDSLFDNLREFIAENGVEKVVAALNKKIAQATDIANPNSITTQRLFPFLFVYMEAKAFALTEAAVTETNPEKKMEYQVRAGETLVDIKSYSQAFGRTLTSLNFIYQQLGRLGNLGRQAYARKLVEQFRQEAQKVEDELRNEVEELKINNSKLAKEIDELQNQMQSPKEFVAESQDKITERVSKIISNICKKLGF